MGKYFTFFAALSQIRSKFFGPEGGKRVGKIVPARFVPSGPKRFLNAPGFSARSDTFDIPATNSVRGVSVLLPGLEVVDGLDDLHHLGGGADVVQNVGHPLVGHGALVQGGPAH